MDKMAGLGMGFLTMGFSAQQKVGQPQLRPGDILVVIHDFNARSSDELTLRKSERVELIELDEGFGDGWYLGRHLSRGGTGLFPGVYTTRAPPTPNRPVPPQSVHRSSYSPPTSSFSNAPLSPIPPSPAGYQSADSPTDTTSRISQYSPAFVYDAPRTSLPAAYSSHAPSVQRSIGQTLGNDRGDGDSPVMNETLSVIDEHITNLSTPRQSAIPPKTINEDSESEYSSRLDQQSYIAGPETDDEENEGLKEDEVRKWDHKKMAEHLRSIGVDAKHCDIFEEQEISGEVLLDMDQGFIYMKEYDFGVMGRRLKTWHKIRDFQTEVKGGTVLHQSALPSVDGSSSIEDGSRVPNRLLSNATLLPRIPSLKEKPGLNIRQASIGSLEEPGAGSNQLPIPAGLQRTGFGGQTPPSPWRASMISEGSSRPSAAMVREISHSRRHSSIDFGKRPDLGTNPSQSMASHTSHQKQPSLDRDWSLSASTLGMTASPTTTNMSTPRDLATKSPANSPPIVTNLDPDVDRGYFSGNELDNRKSRNILKKRDSGSVSAMHSRQSSANNLATKRHSRLASVDSIREIGSQAFSPASKAYHGLSQKSRFRSSSARGSISKSPVTDDAPAVTNLEDSRAVASPPRATSTGPAPKLSMQNKARKLIGLRASSEMTTGNDKATPQVDTPQDSSRASPVASPTGSTTPSGTSRSLELEATETTGSSKLNDVPGLTLPKAQARNRPKAKQETSAYQRGLLKITTEEARKSCDYSGWMKKKSSSLVTTWKPRLFILRGRRLSYYYAETDTEERGIIDISGHKVLVANSDAMVTLHAQITGAASTASPKSVVSSTEPSPNPVKSPEPGSSGLFYFKLVPPKSGMSRAVQFTKPTVHYFQVDSIEDGRKWMGEIMKATIEHDPASFETTNKQKLISLAKARARRERPPALMEGDEPTEVPTPDEEDKENLRESGLNIQGLDFSNSPVSIEAPSEALNGDTKGQRNSGSNPATTAVQTASAHTA